MFPDEKWIFIIALMFLLVLCFMMPRFVKLSNKDKSKTIKAFLLVAVSIAEKELGSKKGQEKFFMVYKMFEANFPVISKYIPFALFNKWVNEALKRMEETLSVDAIESK